MIKIKGACPIKRNDFIARLVVARSYFQLLLINHRTTAYDTWFLPFLLLAFLGNHAMARYAQWLACFQFFFHSFYAAVTSPMIIITNVIYFVSKMIGLHHSIILTSTILACLHLFP